jgi:D-3-phosphoglycerate dehydrogenase
MAVSLPLSLSKDKIRIVLLEGIHPRAVEVFREHGYTNVESLSSTLADRPLAKKIGDAHMVGIRSRTQISPGVLEGVNKLIAIGCFCIGIDQVSLEDAAAKGIPVFNAPHSNTRSVAEMVIGLTIMLLRDIFPKSLAAHRHEWKKSKGSSYEARGKTLGIVGYGHIGSQVSVLAEAMGMHVVYYDIQTKLPLGNARTVDSLDSLLEISDVVTLHVPEDESTRKMMTGKKLGRMKGSACLINASRGSVVDLEALADALKSGHLRGAAIDVFPMEPGSSGEYFASPLIGLENVILTPHIGGSTLEAQENIGAEVANKLVYFSDRGATQGAVNFPAVNLQPNENTHRILHIHENKPGILKAINEKVANRGINVLGQYLETRKQIGYVVLDVDPDVSRQLLQELRVELTGIDGTIRTRVLY